MSLTPGRSNFQIYQGATFRQRITLLTSDSTSAPQDLTGYTAACTIRDEAGGSTLLALTDTDGIVLGGVNGTIDLVITDEQTELLTWDVGFYDLMLTEPGGDTDLYLIGSFTVLHL